MEREIKFRGKIKESAFRWICGSYNQYNKCIVGANGGEYLVDENTIGQFTELPDKNGKEIYEHDIVDAPYVDCIFRDVHPTARVKAVIKFINGAFVVEYSEDCRIYLQDLHDKIEVIGNTYDNPELLKQD